MRERSSLDAMANFDALPITREVLAGPDIKLKLTKQFQANLALADTDGLNFIPCDYCYVAMRKLPRGQADSFRPPTQAIYRRLG